MFEGFGSEIGVVNSVVMMFGIAALAFTYKKVKLFLLTDIEKLLRQHRRMWRAHMRAHIDDTNVLKDD